jgi:hypothetical protein
MAKPVASLVLGLSVFASGFARADEDVLSPRAIGVGEALRAAATGAIAATLNPAGIVTSRSYVIEGSYGFRPDDKSHIQMVSICDSVTTRVGACIYYKHLSADPSEDGDRSLHDVGITLAAPLGPNFAIGVTNRYVNYAESVMEEVPVDTSKKGLMLDAGVTFRVLSPLSVAVVGYNLFGGDEQRYARALGGGIAFTAAQKLLIAADVKYDFEAESTRMGGGAEYLFSGADAQQGLPIRLGYVYDTEGKASYVTGGLGFVTPRVGLDLGARKQVTEGDELMMQFSLRLFLPN